MRCQLSSDAQHQLDRFSRQYFQLELALDYPDVNYLRNDAFQQSLDAKLFSSSIVRLPPQRYRLRVLKSLIQKIEQSIQDWDEEGICDGLMNHLSLLLSSSIPSETISAQQRSCVTYTLSSLDSGEHDPPSISLLESRNLVAAAGTTGLRTWESALHLGEYLCANSQSLVHGRSILELGAGTAYVSILCARHLRASNVIATDGSEDVVASLTDNFLLNGLQDGAIIQGKELKWGQPLVSGGRPECNGDRRVDLVLGADITFDESANAALVSTFRDIFDLSPDVKFILAAPVRNPKTFDLFLEACRRNGYKLEEIEFGTKTAKLQTGPFYADKVPIRLCLIIKS